eukprot:TRINITY_DN7158_c0_g1_i1.p1 TRINITY_DN7158_c0_g1~~TRINITY_DN7158_c0_g1_i1.p1  ORF type:complete len:463 (-),score=106.70 TRINITY_DN7158_c0_g1_i1:52-1440(-)
MAKTTPIVAAAAMKTEAPTATATAKKLVPRGPRSVEATERRAKKRNRSTNDQKKVDQRNKRRRSLTSERAAASTSSGATSGTAPKSKALANAKAKEKSDRGDKIKKTGGWACSSCQKVNFASRGTCHDRTCTGKRPADVDTKKIKKTKKKPPSAKKLDWASAPQAGPEKIAMNIKLRKLYAEDRDSLSEEDLKRAVVLIARDEKKKSKKETRKQDSRDRPPTPSQKGWGTKPAVSSSPSPRPSLCNPTKTSPATAATKVKPPTKVKTATKLKPATTAEPATKSEPTAAAATATAAAIPSDVKRPYPCKVCSFAGTRKATLKKHMRSHTAAEISASKRVVAVAREQAPSVAVSKTIVTGNNGINNDGSNNDTKNNSNNTKVGVVKSLIDKREMKKKQCSFCDFATVRRDHLKRHVKRLHADASAAAAAAAADAAIAADAAVAAIAAENAAAAIAADAVAAPES